MCQFNTIFAITQTRTDLKVYNNGRSISKKLAGYRKLRDLGLSVYYEEELYEAFQDLAFRCT